MDPFHLCVALGPVSLYLLMLAGINLSRRPFVVSGARDLLALSLATAGLFVVGPLALFMPHAGSIVYGAWIWLALLGLYAMASLLIALLARPRLIVYNSDRDTIRAVIDQVSPQLDAQAMWAGECCWLPKLGVQFALESNRTMRNVELVATHLEQDLSGWHTFQVALRQPLAGIRVSPNPRGRSCLGFALLIWIMLAVAIQSQPEQWVAGLEQFLSP